MIRTATLKDHQRILEITNQVILSSNSIYREEPHTVASRQAWFDAKEAHHIPIFVYEEAGIVCGFATYGQFRDNPGYRFSVEHSLHIDEAYRHKGIGTQLFQHLINHLKNTDTRLIIGVIDEANSHSLHLHEKFGFKNEGTIHNVAIKHKQWLNVCFMVLDLKA